MSFKTKALGLAAATALSITMVGGAMAAPGDTSVTLKDGAACAASVSAGTISFGNYTWNGTSYQYDNDNSAGGSLTVHVTDSKKNDTKCAVTMSISDMSGVTVPANKILAANIGLTATGATGSSPTFTVSPVADFTVDATLTVPNSAVPGDTYNGTILVGSQTGS